MADLKHLLKSTLAEYVGPGAGGATLALFDDEHETYGLALVDYQHTENRPQFMILVRLLGQKVLIEEDITGDTLANLLQSKGLPAEQITCVRPGEAYPIDLPA
jgi:hypothetical protein